MHLSMASPTSPNTGIGGDLHNSTAPHLGAARVKSRV